MTGAQIDLDDLKVNREGEVPIGVQLAWALRARIGDGRLVPGQRLPGLRELAEMVGINANTARAVYQRLEQEGLIDSRQGTGTFVASAAHEPSAVGRIAADAARQARRTGVDPREVAAALYVASGSASDAPAQPRRASEAARATPRASEAPARATPPAALTRARTQAAERRRELRDQIAALEGTLSEVQALNPSLIPAPAKASRHAGPRLLSVEDLERVRGRLVRRLAEAEALFQAPARVESAPRTRKTARSAVAAKAKGADQARTSEAAKGKRPRPSARPSTA
ncbi:MAG TPA: GntR family transcriptional regulator [Solirubrobacteraceae bacterium]